MRNLRPVYLMCEDGVENFKLQAVLGGIRELLQLAKMDSKIQIQNFGVWRHKNWQQGGQLVPYNSVDWYLANARKYSMRAGQLNGDSIMRDLQTEPWQKAQQHYDVMVLNSDIYSEGAGFVIGLAIEALGMIVSASRFRSLLDRNLQAECIKTASIHEMGHVFGLPAISRKENVEQSLGLHCTNLCTMRQGLEVPRDWLVMTSDRLARGALCSQCQRDLHTFFT